MSELPTGSHSLCVPQSVPGKRSERGGRNLLADSSRVSERGPDRYIYEVEGEGEGEEL